MAKPKSIEWVNRALLELFEIATYIQQEFGAHFAEDFVREAFEKIEVQARYPESGSPSRRFKTIRYIHLGKHHRLYYRVQGSRLFVVYIFDTRMDPEKNLYR